MNTKTLTLSALMALSGLSAQAATSAWIGGDQSAVDSSLEVADNWDNGAIVNASGNSFVIDQNGAKATMKHANTGYYITGGLSIGSDENPDVSVEFTSTRGVVTIDGVKYPDNSSPAALRVGGILKAAGSNTTIKINRGFALALRNNNDGKTNFAQIGAEVKFAGEGIINFGDGSRLVPGNDYGDLWVQIGQESNARVPYSLSGDLSAKQVELIQSGTGGIGGLSMLDLAGHTLSAQTLMFGTLDNRTGDSNPGNQSSFGAIIFNGGTVKVTGDIRFRGDVDGSSTYNGTHTPFVNDHYLSTAQQGGRLELGGSMKTLSRSNADWFLNDLTVVFNGDGSSVQEFEALQRDVGDTRDCITDAYAFGRLELVSGASVKLVDECDNDRADVKAEAVYTRELIVGEGAKLDLGGLNLYVLKKPQVSGRVINGTVVQLKNAGVFSTLEYVLGTPGTVTTGTKGNWVGPMAAGDLDGDGHPELAVVQMDEDANCDDSKVFVLKYDGEKMNPVYEPLLDLSLFQNATPSQMRYADLGDGKGERLIYASTGYSDIRAYTPDNAGYETITANASYGNSNFVLADLNKDGCKEVITAYRDGRTANLKIYDARNAQTLWTKLLAADANIVTRVGVADLDNDRRLEVMALTKTANAAGAAAAYRLHVFNADGSENRVLTLDFVRNEGAGLITAHDLTGDGKKEIVIVETTCNNNFNNPTSNTEGGVFVVDAETGATLFHVYAAETDWTVSHTTAQFFDLDNDGVMEFVYGDKIYKGSITGKTASFSVIDTLPVPARCYFCFTLAPALVDLTGDGVPEIVYGCTVPEMQDRRTARQVIAYDPVAKSILSGFPVAMVSTQHGSDTDEWRAGLCQHWYMASLLAADFDGDGKWEIAVGLGTPKAGQTTRASLNIIKTPYSVVLPQGRTEREMGAWSYGRDDVMTFAYPLKKRLGLVIVVR